MIHVVANINAMNVSVFFFFFFFFFLFLFLFLFFQGILGVGSAQVTPELLGRYALKLPYHVSAMVMDDTEVI